MYKRKSILVLALFTFVINLTAISQRWDVADRYYPDRLIKLLCTNLTPYQPQKILKYQDHQILEFARLEYDSLGFLNQYSLIDSVGNISRDVSYLKKQFSVNDSIVHLGYTIAHKSEDDIFLEPELRYLLFEFNTKKKRIEKLYLISSPFINGTIDSAVTFGKFDFDYDMQGFIQNVNYTRLNFIHQAFVWNADSFYLRTRYLIPQLQDEKCDYYISYDYYYDDISKFHSHSYSYLSRMKGSNISKYYRNHYISYSIFVDAPTSYMTNLFYDKKEKAKLKKVQKELGINHKILFNDKNKNILLRYHSYLYRYVSISHSLQIIVWNNNLDKSIYEKKYLEKLKKYLQKSIPNFKNDILIFI